MQNAGPGVSESWEHPQVLITLRSVSAPTYRLSFGPGAFFKLKSMFVVLVWAMEYVPLCPAWLPPDPDIFIKLAAWLQSWPSPLISDDHWAELVTVTNPAWSGGTAPLLVKSMPQPVPRSALAPPPLCSSRGLAAPRWSAPPVTSLQLIASFY